MVSALVDLAKLNSWNLSMMSLLTWKMENKQIFWSWIFQKLLTRSHTLLFYINYTIMAYRANKTAGFKIFFPTENKQ